MTKLEKLRRLDEHSRWLFSFAFSSKRVSSLGNIELKFNCLTHSAHMRDRLDAFIVQDVGRLEMLLGSVGRAVL